jgi:hypothetical protein
VPYFFASNSIETKPQCRGACGCRCRKGRGGVRVFAGKRIPNEMDYFERTTWNAGGLDRCGVGSMAGKGVRWRCGPILRVDRVVGENIQASLSALS